MTISIRRRVRPAIAGSLVFIVLAAGGCVGSLNERPTLGGSERLPALSPVADVAPPPPDAAMLATTRLDRGGWAPVDFVVPVDGVAHDPMWRTAPRYAETDTPRRFGRFPTVESALELETPGDALAREALLMHAHAMVEAAILPFRVFFEPVQDTRQSPATLYKRTPGDAWWSGPTPPAMTPIDADAEARDSGDAGPRRVAIDDA